MRTVVHLLRHGEVHNPDRILYGRAVGFPLSERGRAMAERIADRIGGRDITHVIASPLQRAQETAAPLAEARGLLVESDGRLIESANVFEGRRFSVWSEIVRRPGVWRRLWNPLRPSWGEPYSQLAARMWAAVCDARAEAAGHEAVLVSHQLPIWTVRMYAERRRFAHDPRRRRCTLCSLTSLEFDGDRLVSVGYWEPALDLVPAGDRQHTFSAGGRSAPSGPAPGLAPDLTPERPAELPPDRPPVLANERQPPPARAHRADPGAGSGGGPGPDAGSRGAEAL